MLKIKVNIESKHWETVNSTMQQSPLPIECKEFYYEIVKNVNEHAFCDLTNKDLARSSNKTIKETKQFLNFLKKNRYISIIESKFNHKRMIYPLAVC